MKKKVPIRVWFVLGNILLVTLLVGLLWAFTADLEKTSREEERQSFIQNTDIIRLKVADHMETSCRFVQNWTKLAKSKGWRLEEIPRELAQDNTDDEVTIQILQMDTMTGVSSKAPEKHPFNYYVDYSKYYTLGQELREFAENGQEGEVLVTSAFTNCINAESSIAFATKLSVRSAEGIQKEAFLLRIEPLSRLERMWSYFDTEADSQVSMINAQGDYTVRASMLKNENFYEFLRSYNDINYGMIQKLRETISNAQEPGGIVYLNSKKEETLFAYASSGPGGWIIIRSIPLKDLNGTPVQWTLLTVMGLSFLAMLILNTAYFMALNRRLRRSMTELEEASEAKTRFLSTMSHDMRTPMNAILGLAELAERHLEEPERIRDSLKKISMAGGHLLTLVNDVLDVSQIESGHVPMKPSVFSLEESAGELVNMLYAQTVEKQLDCEIYLRNITENYLYADRLRLNQIWINLLSNAVKYTPTGGRIEITLEQWDTGKKDRIGLRFRSRDTGIGMSPEFQTHLFDAFSREQDGRIDKIQGTGLGMAIVKQLVDQMEGNIFVESAPGKGSCFTVELELDTARSPKPERDYPGLRVLLVGDPEITRSTWVFLEELGAQADQARDESAADWLRDHPGDYQLVLMDRKMADRSCLALAKALRALPDCPLIAISTFDCSDIEEEARELGGVVFADRPLFRTGLSRFLEELELRRGEAEEPKPHGTSLAGIRLLVAEDNEINWEIIQELLEMEGISADHAENGRQCLEMLQRTRPGAYTAILMDIQMPLCNGIEATKAIRRMRNPQLSRIPILAMTANAFADDIADCMEAGMNGHIAKPVDPKILRMELEKIVEGETHI